MMYMTYDAYKISLHVFDMVRFFLYDRYIMLRYTYNENIGELK